jgi:hypothetical protein
MVFHPQVTAMKAQHLILSCIRLVLEAYLWHLKVMHIIYLHPIMGDKHSVGLRVILLMLRPLMLDGHRNEKALVSMRRAVQADIIVPEVPPICHLTSGRRNQIQISIIHNGTALL